MKILFFAATGLFLALSVSAETIQYKCYGPDGAVQLDHVAGHTLYFKQGKRVGWLNRDTASLPKKYPKGFVPYSGMFYENPKMQPQPWKAHVSRSILEHKSQGMFVFGMKKHYCER